MARGPLPPGHWLLPAVLAITIATASAGACPEPPAKEVVCYYEGRSPAAQVDSCLCTSLVFTHAASRASDNVTFGVDIGMRSQVRAMKKRNPWLRVLLQLQVPTDQLKSEERRLRASQAVTAALRKATADGVELVADWSHHGTNKTHLTAFIKAVRFQLDAADAVDRRRAKRDYEIFERQVEDETTESWRPTLATRQRATSPPSVDAEVESSPPASHRASKGVQRFSPGVQPSVEPDVASAGAPAAPGALGAARGRGHYSRARGGHSRGSGQASGQASGQSSSSSRPTRPPRPPGRTPSSSGTSGGTRSSGRSGARSGTRGFISAQRRTTKSMSTTTAAEEGETAETTEPATANTQEETEGTTEPATGRTGEATLTTDTVPPTATTARPVARTTRTEGSTASDAADLARQYADLEGDLHDEDYEPTRLLALQLPAKPELIAKYYDLRTMSKYVDWFAIPSQNLTDESERGYTFHHSRLMGLDDLLNTDSLVDLVTGLGAPHSQIVISLPAFALRFALKDETKNTPRSAVSGSPAILTQTELCSLISEGGWSLERDQDLTAPYAFKNGSWVAFEDHMSVSIKAKYVLLRDLAGLAIQSVDDEDWLETSCKRPAAPQQVEESEKKSKDDEGQIAGADGDNGDYHGDYAELEADGEKRKAVDESLKKPDVEKKPTNVTTPEAPMPFTLLETIFKSLTESSRRSRAALLSSLEDDIHQHAVQYSDYTGSVELSPYQIVRVVDREGEVHVVRKNAQTEFKCSRQGYFVHPLSCNRFYRCVKFNQLSSDYTVYEFDCPAGLAFDERYEVCVWPGSLPDGGACHGSSEIAPVPRALYGCPNNEGYYADPENCRWFFACLDHARDGLTPLTAYEFRCPFGLVFDEGRQVCNWPWLVDGCGNSGRQGVLRFHSGLYTGSAGAAAGFGTYNANEGLIEGTSLLSAGISASDLAAGSGAAGYSQGAAGYSQGAAGYSQGAAGAYSGGAAVNSAASGLSSGSSLYNSAAASGLSSGSAAYNNAAYNSAAYNSAAAGYSSGSSGYNSDASSFGASGVASNSLHSSDVGLGFNAAGSSQQHASGFGSANAAYSNLGSSLYKHTSGVSGSSLASEINANLHASSYADQSSGTGNYGENNGYIAYSGQSQEGGSRYDDRGYGGYATFPDSYISGGRIEGSSGVVLGSNLHQGSLQGIVKESGSYGYKTGAALGSTTNSGAYVSSQQGSGTGYQYSTGPSSSYSSGASSASTVGAAVSQANLQETGSLSGQIVQVASDGSSGYSGAQIHVTATPIVHSSEYSVTPAPVSVSTYQAEHVSQNVHAVTPAPAVYTFKEPVVQVQSVTPIPVTPVHQVKFQTFSPAPAVSSYRQEHYNSVQEVQPVGKLHFQAVTPTPYPSYQQGQSHQSVSSAFGLKQFVTPAPAVVSYEVKQPEVLVQSVTPAPAVVNYQQYEVKQPIVQQKTVKFSPAVEYQHQQTYHSITPAPAIVSYQQHEVKQPEIHVQSVTPAPAVVSYQQYEVKRPEILLQPVAPAAVAYEKQQSFQSVTPTVPTYNQYEVRKPLLQVQQVSPTPGIVSFEQQQTYVSSTPKTINYKQFELKQPLVHVQSVTPAPAIVSYQSVTPSYEVKQAVTPAPAAPAIFTYKKYEVKQPVVHFQSVSPAPVTATTSYGSVNFAPTVAPAIVSVAHQYKEHRPLLPVQPVTAAPAVSYFRKQTPTPRPAFVTPIPAVGSYQQEQYYQSVTPASVGHSVQYSYSTPAPFSLGNVKYNRIVDIKQEPVGYYNSYNQEVQQVQHEVQRLAPAVQYQAPAVAVQYEQKQQNEHHAVQHQVQQFQQVQPVVPAVQYQTPAVSVQYEQKYQKVQHPVHQQQYYQEVQQVQPVQPDLKVEAEQTVQPIVQQVDYQQNVRPIQPAVQYRQEIKQVQPVFPAANLEYQSPKIQVQQYQQVHEVKQVQPAIAKVEYQVPATQFQEIKTVQPVVQYQQQYHEVKKVQPVVEYNQQYQIKQAQPVTTVEFQKPRFSYQQKQNTYEGNSGFQYNQEVHVAKPVVSDYNEAPVVYKQTYQQTVQPVGNYVQQQYVSPTPAVSTFRKPSVTAQEIVYKYSTPSSIPIRQEQVKQVQFSTVQYPTPAPSLSVTYKPKLYPFVTRTEGPTIVSTTPAPLQSYSSGYSSTYSTDQNVKLAVPVDSSVTTVTKAPLVQSYTYSEGYVSSTPAYAEQSVICNTCSQSTTGLHVSTTPAPVPVVKQQTPVAFKFQERLVSSTPKYEQGSVYVNDQRQYGVVHQVNQQAGYYGGEYDVQHNVEEEPPVALFVQTPGPGHYSQQVYSSTPAPGVGVVQQSVSHIQSERVYPERPARPIVAGYSTVTPAPQVEFVKAVQPEIKTQVIENYSSVRPEVYSQAYYTTARPAVVKTVVTQQIPISTVEPVGFVSSAQDVEFGAKKTNVVSEYNYVQSNIAPAPTPAPVPIYSATPQAVQVEYQSTASPAVSVEDIAYTTQRVPVRRLRPTTTTAPYVEEQQQIVSEEYSSGTIPVTTPGYVAGLQQSYRGSQRYQEGEEAGAIVEQYDGNFGGKNEYSGLAQVIESSTIGAIEASSQYPSRKQNSGRVRVSSVTEGYDGYSSTDGYNEVSSTVRNKSRKRTKIVVVTRLSDVNPLLIGKLGAQCSCADANQSRRRRPGVKRVVSRVRVVRPKDAILSTEDYVSSTTEGYEALSSSARTIAANQEELEEDIALIRDAEKSDKDEDDDDNDNNVGDFGIVISSTEGSSSAAYEDESASVSTSTAASRARSRARGRTTYIRAGKAKSTIYVSTTAEPDDEVSSSSAVYEVTTASTRSSTARSGRRTTARSIRVNKKEENDDDKDAVVIKPRPRSGAGAHSRTDNEVATPGPGHTVDLGANGVVECKRPGLFRHPELCNKFYSCNWDSWKKKYVVNVFNCPIHLAYDTTIGACNWPSKGPACVNGKLLV